MRQYNTADGLFCRDGGLFELRDIGNSLLEGEQSQSAAIRGFLQ